MLLKILVDRGRQSLLCDCTGVNHPGYPGSPEDEGLLSCAGSEDCAVLCEDCDIGAPEGRANTLTAGL